MSAESETTQPYEEFAEMSGIDIYPEIQAMLDKCGVRYESVMAIKINPNTIRILYFDSDATPYTLNESNMLRTEKIIRLNTAKTTDEGVNNNDSAKDST